MASSKLKTLRRIKPSLLVSIIVAAVIGALLPISNALTHEQSFSGNCGLSYLPPPNEMPGRNWTITILPAHVAKANEVPWQARILVDGKFKCSAAIVNSRAVATSATCLQRAVGDDDEGGPLGRLRVIVGAAFDFRAGRYGESVFRVTRISTHGNFILDPNKNINDLAYITLDGSIGSTNSDQPSGNTYVDQAFVRPACVVSDGAADIGKPGHVAVMSFWLRQEVESGPGSPDHGQCDVGDETPSSYLPLPNKAWLRIVPTEECMEYFPINRRLWPADHYLCAEANPMAIKANICCAEGGAPLVQKFGDRWYLIGLFTQIAGCQYKPVGDVTVPPLLLFASTTGTQVSWMTLHQPDDPEETTTRAKAIRILASAATHNFPIGFIIMFCAFALSYVFG